MTVERGARTRGQVARAMTGADAIEIKATIPHHQVGTALQRFKLTPRNDEERYIYFFDTPALELLDAGIIVRARRVVGDVHDSTVKFRPVDPSALSNKWRRFRDFKVEADASEKGLVRSASFSMPARKGLIKRVAKGTLSIRGILMREQLAFIERTAGRKVDLDRLKVLGPLRAHRWQFEDAACPWPITAELWIRQDRQRMMELSIKAPAAQAAVAVGGFMAFLAEVGVERDRAEQTKTRWALGYYAGKRGASAGAGSVRVASARVAPASKRKQSKNGGPTVVARTRARKRVGNVGRARSRA